MCQTNLPGKLTCVAHQSFYYIALFAAFLFFIAGDLQVNAQNPVLIEQNEYFGYRDRHGVIVIPMQYSLAEEFSKEGIAAVLDKQGWAYIDRTGKVLVRPFIFDNGPDEFRGGRARMVERGKVGFFDKFGRVVIKPRFDFAGYFADGLAAVCTGCRSEKADAEHSITVGGRWGYIDRTGRLVIPLNYESGGDFARGKADVKMNGKWYEIDRRGKVIGKSRIGK